MWPDSVALPSFIAFVFIPISYILLSAKVLGAALVRSFPAVKEDISFLKESFLLAAVWIGNFVTIDSPLVKKT